MTYPVKNNKNITAISNNIQLLTPPQQFKKKKVTAVTIKRPLKRIECVYL